jgi:hypothetical protein
MIAVVLLLASVLGLSAALPTAVAAPLACLLASTYAAYRAERPAGYRMLPAVTR